VFGFVSGKAGDDPFQSMWILCFFETLWIGAFTVPHATTKDES
jgi:hypothetical protein